MLYSINETTLIKWFKNQVRRDEITLLMQGLTPPQQPLCANESLPPAKELPTSPGPPPVNPHIIIEPEDRTGTIRSRVRRKSSAPDPSGLNTPSAASPVIVNPLAHLDPSGLMAALSSFGLVNPTTAASSSDPVNAPGPSGLVNPSSTPTVSDSNPPPSRTTVWRQKRDRQEGKISRPRKAYTCKVCKRPMTSEGHSQFRGQRYCPSAPGQIPLDEWLQKKKDEAARPPDRE